MVQTVSAQDINLRNLIDKFQLERVQNQVEFFPEWHNLDELNSTEKQQQRLKNPVSSTAF
jgi:hypothetical protein